MSHLLYGSIGLAILGLPGALAGAAAPMVIERIRNQRQVPTNLTTVLLMVMIELRSGASVLAALMAVSDALPEDAPLLMVSRVARVAGIMAAVEVSDNRLRPLVAQLSRAQRTGASLTDVVRRLLETELGSDRARRLARARGLPVRLMLPVTLLMLPGLVIFTYAPSLLAMFDELTGVFR